MKRFLLSLALFASFAAMATPGGEGNNTGCNGVGNANSPCAGTPGNGGAGGQGGAGGSAAAVAAAQARANARATAIAAQQQAQQQAQVQGQSQTSRNTNNVRNNVSNTVTGGAVSVSVSLPASTATAPDKTAAPSETVKETPAAQKADTLIADVDNTRIPVSTAYAAPLTSSPETCMGSSSGGVQGASFGVSIASTWESVKCDRRMFARALDGMGKRNAAIALLCLDADVKKAMADAGTPCPGTEGKRAEAILNGQAGE